MCQNKETDPQHEAILVQTLHIIRFMFRYLYTRMIHVMKKAAPMVKKYASGMLYERCFDMQSRLVPLDTFIPPSSFLQFFFSISLE